MFSGPGKVVEPNNTEGFADWQDFRRVGEAENFDYSDKTSEHIGGGESQEFHYGQNPLPEKM